MTMGAWDDLRYLYIGRWNSTYQLPQSKWCNPYKVNGMVSRDRAISLFTRYMEKQVAEGYLNIRELRGKTLVCWCAPDPCHGDALKAILDRLNAIEQPIPLKDECPKCGGAGFRPMEGNWRLCMRCNGYGKI